MKAFKNTQAFLANNSLKIFVGSTVLKLAIVLAIFTVGPDLNLFGLTGTQILNAISLIAPSENIKIKLISFDNNLNVENKKE